MTWKSSQQSCPATRLDRCPFEVNSHIRMKQHVYYIIVYKKRKTKQKSRLLLIDITDTDLGEQLLTEVRARENTKL